MKSQMKAIRLYNLWFSIKSRKSHLCYGDIPNLCIWARKNGKIEQEWIPARFHKLTIKLELP